MKFNMLTFCGEVVHPYSSGILAYGFLLLESVCISGMVGPVRALSWVVQKPVPWEALTKLENWPHAPLFSFSTEKAAEPYWPLGAVLCVPCRISVAPSYFVLQWSFKSNWVPATLRDSEMPSQSLGKPL